MPEQNGYSRLDWGDFEIATHSPDKKKSCNPDDYDQPGPESHGNFLYIRNKLAECCEM
jgi:hypothetical protein